MVRRMQGPPLKITQYRARTPHLNAAYHELTQLTDGKNSRMRMDVQGRLLQVCLIEIHQVFAKNKVGYFYNRVAYIFP